MNRVLFAREQQFPFADFVDLAVGNQLPSYKILFSHISKKERSVELALRYCIVHNGYRSFVHSREIVSGQISILNVHDPPRYVTCQLVLLQPQRC